MLNKLISHLNKIPPLYFILALMTLLLLSFFLWNEIQSLSIDKKIDHEKFTNFFVTLFTVIGTILSLYFSHQAIKTDVMPEIYPQNFRFKVEEALFRTLATSPIVVRPLTITNKFPYVNLMNTGRGVAKKITSKWKFEDEEILKYVGNAYTILPNIDIAIIELLAPQKEAQINMPYRYLSCCGEKLNINNDMFSLIHVAEKPKLELALNYKDIHNNSYHKVFEVEVSAILSNVSFNFREKL